MLLKYAPLCSFSIRNFITSLKHHPNNSSFIDCILKLKALSCYNYIQNSCFPSQHDGQKVYLFKMSIDRVAFGFDLVQRMQPNDDLQNSWTMFNHVSTWWAEGLFVQDVHQWNCIWIWIWFSECNQVMIYKMHGWCSIT
jgi:hypothetical protein